MFKDISHKGVQLTHDIAPFVLETLRRFGPPETLWRHLYFKGEITVNVSQNAHFRTHHYGYQIENDLYWKGFGNGWEATSLRLWCKLALNAKSIFDIGANTGIYALSAKAVNPTARVYAIEPVARVHTRLEANIALNNWDIMAIQAGISGTSGTATLYDTTGEHEYSASLEKNMLTGSEDVVEYKINTYSMSDFLKERNEDRIDLVKIDTEKHEQAVLRGFGDIITAKQPTVIIEILDRALGRAIESYFPADLFRFYAISEGTGAEKVDELGGGERNYLICPHCIAELNGFGDQLLHNDL